MKCQTKYCKKKSKSGAYCWSCIKKRYAEKHPVKYAFQTLKNNAKRRGVVFGLTFSDFEKFCVKTDYINKRGTGSTGFHVDRIDERKGYFKSNIQALTNTENVKKYFDFKYNHKGKPVGAKVRIVVDEPEENFPF